MDTRKLILGLLVLVVVGLVAGRWLWPTSHREPYLVFSNDEEIRTVLIDKTEAEVVNLLGEPDDLTRPKFFTAAGYEAVTLLRYENVRVASESKQPLTLLVRVTRGKVSSVYITGIGSTRQIISWSDRADPTAAAP